MLFPYCLSNTIPTTAKFKACPKKCVKYAFGFPEKNLLETQTSFITAARVSALML